MNNSAEVLVIVPAYNEEKSISKVIADIQNSMSPADILVVNDGSSDRTAQIARQSGAIVVTHPFNMGYGVSCQTGFKYALEKGYDYAVQIDGDGQHESRCIPDLLREVQNGSADIVIGSRFLGDCIYKTQFTRRVGMILFGFIASTIIRQKITDVTSGFQAINKDVIKFYTSDVYPVDFPDTDVLIMLHFAGFRIKEIPVIMYQKAESEKSMHSGILKPSYYVFKMLLSIFMTLLRERRSFQGL